MFTGIISDIGSIISASEAAGELRLRIRSAYDISSIKLGESIACNGVCLTVVELSAESFDVELSAETLRCTAPYWQVGKRLNLERALKMGDDLSGHLVSGHVDGMGEITRIQPAGESHIIDISFDDTLAPYMAPKGSITINGVSLTVNSASSQLFSVNIIPHTWQHTQLADLGVGDGVNLEIDVIARYVVNALHHQGVALAGAGKK